MRQKGSEWINADGREVPTYAINTVLKIEEKHCQKIAVLAKKAEKTLQDLYDCAYSGYDEVLEAKVKEANMRDLKTPREGFSINSFDYTIQVQFTKPKKSYLDPVMVSMVKEKFSAFLSSLNAGNDTADFLKQLVQDLLFTKNGELDSSNVSNIQQYANEIKKGSKKIKNKEMFLEAIELFNSALRKKPGNPGLYIYLSENPGEKKRQVALKITDI